MITPRDKRMLIEAQRVVRQIKAGKLKITDPIGFRNLIEFLDGALRIVDELEKEGDNQDSESFDERD